MNAPNTSLKVIVVLHLILTVWASMAPIFLPTSYIYMNAFILAFGVWSMACPESVDALLMFLILHVISILMDIVFLGIYQPIGHRMYEWTSSSRVGEYRFCLGMSILNLLIKPLTGFILYRMYQDRGGSYSDFGIPGIPNFGGANAGKGNYENIDQPVPTNNVETASPHQTIDSPSSLP